jgi:hypothetical protein
MQTRPRAQLLLTAAAVIALHLTLGWLLLSKTRVFLTLPSSGSLEVVFLPRAAPPWVRNPTPEKAPPRWSRPGAARAAPPAATPGPNAQENNAIHPPIDWGAELARAAKDASAANPARKFKDFGFPRASSAPSASPEFGWSRARIHRVESLPGGGMLVHLNDNCALVFLPLPFVFCAPGHRPSNGNLFEHMQRQSLAGEGKGME